MGSAFLQKKTAAIGIYTMQPKDQTERPVESLEEGGLREALTALGRSINIVSTYGNEHPAFRQSIEATQMAMQALFIDRKSVILGAYNGILAIDNVPINAEGTLLKSLERIQQRW